MGRKKQKKIISVFLAAVFLFGIFFSGPFTKGQSDYHIQAAQTVATPALSIDYRTATTATMKLSRVSNATGYRIYRSTSLYGRYTAVGITRSQTFKDTGLHYNQKYYYKARAYRTVQGRHIFSNYSKVAGLASTVGKSTYLTVNASSQGVKLNWSKVPYAIKYNVYRSSSLNGTYSYIGSSYGQSYTDSKVTAGKSYYYRIRGYKKGAVIRYYGVFSDIKKVTVPSKSNEDTTQSGTSSNSEYTKEVLRLVNIEREKEGLSPLKTNATLEKAAFVRAKETEKKFAHTRPDGSSCFTILEEMGISYMAAGENIAYGQRNPKEVVTAWMNSSGHRANIMSKSFGKIGIGCYINKAGTVYWTQLFTN